MNKAETIGSIIEKLKTQGDELSIQYDSNSIKSIDIGSVVLNLINCTVDVDEVCKLKAGDKVWRYSTVLLDDKGRSDRMLSCDGFKTDDNTITFNYLSSISDLMQAYHRKWQHVDVVPLYGVVGKTMDGE